MDGWRDNWMAGRAGGREVEWSVDRFVVSRWLFS